MSVNNTQRALLANYLLGQGSSSTQGKNYVKNSMAINGIENVTANGSATVAKNTTTPLTGISDFAVTLPNSGGSLHYIEWSLDALDKSLNGANCQLSFDYKITSIGSKVQGQVYIGGNLSAAQTIPPSPTTSTFSMNVPCGDLSGSTTVRLANATSNTGASTINIANVYYGRATNIGTTAQAKLIGTVTVTGCATPWSTTSTTYASFATVASCSYAVTGEALAPTTNIPAIRFASLPPGEYKVEYEGALYTIATAGRQDADFQIFDGTNQDRETSAISGTSVGDFKPNFMASYSYTAPKNNITLEVRAKTSNSQTTQIYGTTSRPGVIRVYYFPSASQQVYNQSLTPIYWSGAHANTCSWTGNSATFADFVADATCTLTERLNKNIGTVNTSGAVLPAITFTPPRLGAYKITVTGSAYHPNSTANYMFRMFDGTNELASAAGVDGDAAPAAGGGSFTLTGIYNATSLNAATIKLQAATSISGLVVQNTLGQGVALDWTILSLDQQFPAPILVGSVTSNSSVAERMERLYATNSGVPAISDQSGSWVTSLTDNGTGDTSINYSLGTFSSAPVCTCSAVDTVGGAFQGCTIYSTTTTETRVRTYNDAGTLVDKNFMVLCMGPR